MTPKIRSNVVQVVTSRRGSKLAALDVEEPTLRTRQRCERRNPGQRLENLRQPHNDREPALHVLGALGTGVV